MMHYLDTSESTTDERMEIWKGSYLFVVVDHDGFVCEAKARTTSMRA